MNIEIEFSYVDKNEFILFLHDIDDDFSPKLSKKIIFESYFEKVKNNGRVILAFDCNELIGLLVYYDNLENAQVTLVGVKKAYRGKKISYMLFDKLFSIVTKPINIITWAENDVAKQLYLKLGFKIVMCNKNTYSIDELLMVRK